MWMMPLSSSPMSSISHLCKQQKTMVNKSVKQKRPRKNSRELKQKVLNRIHENILKRKQAEREAEGLKELVEDSAVVKKQTTSIEDQLIRRYLGPDYRKCSVHLTSCIMDYRKGRTKFPALSRNFSDLKHFDNSRTVEDAKVKNKKIKVEKCISKLDNTPTDFWNTSEVGNVHGSLLSPVSVISNHEHEDVINGTRSVAVESACKKRSRSGDKQCPGNIYNMSCETNTQLVQPHSTDALETKKGRRMRSGNCQVVGGTAGNEECKEGWLKIKLINSSEQSEKEKTSQMRKFQPKTSQKKVNGACYQSDKIKTPAEKKIYAGKTQSVVKQEQKIEKHYDSEEEAVPPVNVIQKQKKKRVRSTKGPLVTEEGEGQEGNCCDKSEDLPLANLIDKNKKKRENIVYAEKLQPCEQKVNQSHSEGSKEDGLPRVNAVNKKTKTRQKNKKRTKREQLLVEEEEKAQEGNHCDKSEECLLPLVINQKKQKSAEARDMLNGVTVGSGGGNMNNKKLQFVVTEDGQGQFRKESGRVSSGSRDAGQEGTESPKNGVVESQGVITDSSKNTMSGDTECDVKSDDNNNSGNRDSWRAKRGPKRDREVNVASGASGRHLECEETLGRPPNETSITIHDEQNHCIDSDESVISGSEENNVASKFALVPYTSSIIQSKTDESGTDEDEQVHHATSIERKRTSDDTDIEESDNEQIFQSTGIKRKRSDSDSDEVEYHHKQIRHNTSTEYKRAISDSSDGEEHDNHQTHCSSSTEHKRTVSDSDEESDNEQKQIHHSTRTKHKRTVSDSDEDESDNEQIHRSTRTEHKRTVSDSDKGESDNEQIHHSPRTEQKRTVSDSDEDERDNEQIHRSTSIKQKTTVSDKNEVKCDSEQICHTSRTKRNRIVINSICDDNNRIPIIDKSDSEEDGDDNSQCNSGSNQNKSTSDSEQDSDTGSSGDVSNELHLNDGSSDLNSTKTEKTTCTISMSGKQQLRPEKLMLPPAVVPPVQNDGVQKLLSESMSSAATDSDDDECSDILSLDVETVVVEYVSSRGVNRSMPNPLIPPTVSRKDVFLAANPESRRGVYDFEREFPNRNRTNWNRAVHDYDNDYDSHNKYVSGRRNYSDVGRFNDGSDFNSKNAADASSFRKEFVAIDREASDVSQNRFGSNINTQSGSHVNSRIFSNNSDIRTSIIDAAANDEFMPEDSSRLGYVNPYLRGPPNKSSNGKNKEIKSTNASVKCNFKIPKITRTTANDNVTADKKGGQQFKRPNDVTNRLGGPVVRKPEVSRNSKTDIGMESTERNKFSPKVDNLERSRVISKTGNTEQSKFRPKIDNTERSRVSSKMGNTERSQVSPKIDNTERSRVSPKMGNIERSQVSPKIDNTERSRVSPKMGNIERSQVSPVPERNGIRRSNDELLTVDKAPKRCVEFPAINKTLSFKISTRPQNTELVKCGPTVVDSSSNCKGNDFSSKDMVLNKTGHEFVSAKQTGLGGNFQPKNKNTTVVEKVVKISPVSDRKDNYRPSGLLKGEVALNKLSSKSAIKETESSRKIKANANTNSTEKIKVSPASEESGNCINNEVSTKETALNKRGSENSSTIKLQPERNIKVGSKPGDTNPTLDENVKTDFTVPIRKGSITLNRKSLSLSSESKLEYSGDGNKKVNDVVNQQEHTVTALLADKEAQSAPKNVRKRIVIGDNPEPLKNTKGVPECFSAEKPIGHGRPERKASDSVGQESSPKLENRPRAGTSPEAGGAPTTDKAIADILKIADGLRLFIRKAAPAPVSTTNVVTDDKNPPPQLSQPGESSKGTTTMTCIGDIMTQISPFSDGDLPFEDSPADDENRDVMKSAKLNALFAGQCMTYLKTSKCKTPNCSLLHEVVRLSIRSSGSSNYNNNDDDDDDDVQFSLDVLGEFVSEAPYPPLKLVEESCRILSVYRRSDTILSIVKIFMSQSAQNDVIYMESLLNVLMFALRTFYRNANSTMSVIVKYLCNAVEHNSRKQEILDNVLNIVLKVGRVKLDEMRDIYRCLVPVGDYIWPKWLVSACLFEVNRTPQSALRKKEPDFFRLCSNAILRESHEQQLYSIWKDSGQSLEKFLAYTKCPCPVSHRILRKKIMRFQQMDRTVGHYMPKEQYEQLCGSNAGDTNVSDVGNGTESQNVIEHSSIATRNVDGGAVNVNTTVQASNMSLGDAADFALHPQFKQKGADLKFKSFNQVETANSLTSSIHKHDMYSGLQNERMPFNGSRLQKTVNPSQNMLSVNNSRGTVEEENSTGLNKPSRHWLPIIHVNNQNQRTVLNSQHVLLQNDGSKSFANNVSTLFDNEKMTYEKTVDNSNYNNNNQYENKPLSNNTQIQLPRPAGYRQRINQFNKNRCPATVVCDDGQHNQARGSCEQYPLESTQEHSRSYHGFGVVDQGTQNSFSSDSRHQQSEDVNTLRRSNSSTELNTLSHRRLRRTNSSTSLIDDSWNSANCDDNLPDNNDGMDYSYNQTSRSYLTKVRVPFVLTGDTTSFSNTRGENSRLSLQQHQDAGSRARVTAPRTSMETGSVVCTNSRMNRRSIRPPSRSGTPVLDKPFHENRNASIRGARLNERPAGMLNANAIPFQNRNSSILNPSTGFDLRRRRPSSDLECDFETDQMALQRYLDVNDYHHVLNILEKWEDSDDSSLLTNHLFILLGEVNGNRELSACYNTYRGLMSTAINSGNISPGIRKPLVSISVTLILNFVMGEMWVEAYEIYKLLVDHKFDGSYSCEVFTRDKQTQAKRNLVFVEVCMKMGDFDEAVILLFRHDMLRNREQWVLRSTDADLLIRNQLVETLLDMMISHNNLELASRVIMELMEVHKNIARPIPLVNAYETVLTKYLNQEDTCHAIQLLKMMSTCFNGTLFIYENTLYRPLVVASIREQEMELTRKLVKKAYMIGEYTKNPNLFTVKINSVWTYGEVKVIIEDCLDKIAAQVTRTRTQPVFTDKTVEMDLSFAVTEGVAPIADTHKLLRNGDCSLVGALDRLRTILRNEFDPPLYMSNRRESDSPFIIVKKSLLIRYLTQNHTS